MAKSNSQRRQHNLRAEQAIEEDVEEDETEVVETNPPAKKSVARKTPRRRAASAPTKAEEDEDGLTEGYFIGPVDVMGRREWQAPEVIQGHPASGTLYEFNMLNGEDYSRFISGGISKILENPTQLDPIIANPSYVNPQVDLRDITFWELEALRGAYLMFLVNGD